MELKRIIISEVIDHQMIWLKEVDGDRVFPIVIGIFEATSIDRRVKKMNSPRPLTHDLIASVVDSLGAELQDIYINELRDHTYFAKLRIRQNGELVEIDSRPSGDSATLRLARKQGHRVFCSGLPGVGILERSHFVRLKACSDESQGLPRFV